MRERADLTVVINGGIRTVDESMAHLESVDGVMMGREVCQNPTVLFDVSRRLFARTPRRDRRGVLDAYLPYVEAQRARGVPLARLTPPLLGLFQGVPGTRAFKRHLAAHGHRPGAGAEVIVEAARCAFDLELAA